MPNHTTSFKLGATVVTIETKSLNHGVKNRMRNYFGKYGISQDTGGFDDLDIPIGGIENIAIDNALVNLTVGTDEVKWQSLHKVEDFPIVGMGDDPDEPDLYEEVVKAIVATPGNKWLAVRYPFLIVFSQYLELSKQEEENEELNPTKTSTGQESQGTSSVTRLSGSELTPEQT